MSIKFVKTMTTLRIDIEDNHKLKEIIDYLKSVNVLCEIEENIPNEETIEAIRDAEEGKLIHGGSRAELMSKLRSL